MTKRCFLCIVTYYFTHSMLRYLRFSWLKISLNLRLFVVPIVLVGICGLVLPVLAQKDTYPRLANYYLAWQLKDEDVVLLAKWDVVILDMENQVTNPEKIKKLRELNPNITLLAYITSQEIRDDAVIGTGMLRRTLASGIKPEWFFYNLKGQKISFFPGTFMLNMTPNCPTVDGKKWNKYLAQFVKDEVQSSGLWDGVFYDNAWQDVTWFTKDQADSDRDGRPDSSLDEAWRAGYRFLFNETRRLTGPNFLIVGNMGPGHKQYRDEINGALFELFPQFGWPYAMSVYDYQSKGTGNRLLVVNGSTVTSTRSDYQQMRYTLASTLLGNGYFSFDIGSRHDQIWWYDEYGIDLGAAQGAAEPVITGVRPFFDNTVWKREFKNGLALVNPSNKVQAVNLEGDFEKISGIDDRVINNGQIIDRVALSPFDGLIMLKTFQTVKNSVFVNGSFMRFFTIDGYRARNGIFASETSTVPGAQVFIGDLVGDGTEERVVVTGPKLEIINHEGATIFTDYPYGIAYQNGIELAVGELIAGKPRYVAVAPQSGGEVVVYSHIGELVTRFYPFGSRYQGGFTLAFAPGLLYVGTGRTRVAEVLVYDKELTKAVRRFRVYGNAFTGGVSVAAGDITGDGVPEVITYPQTGLARHLRVFTTAGKMLRDYAVRGVLGSFEARIGIADVNYDGKGEITLMGKQ